MSRPSCGLNPFCLSLESHIRECLCNISSPCTYPPKKNITVKIGKHGYLFLIVKGVAITLKQRPDGRQIGIDCVGQGNIIGLGNILLEERNDITFYTKTEIEACCFSTKDFIDLCSKSPELSIEIIHKLSQRFSQAVSNIEHHALDNSTEKILYRIQKLSYEFMSLQKQVFSFTHEELALLAGMNRVTASRVIDNLKQSGLIICLGKGKFKINDKTNSNIY
ncbi:MAG: hypothetical protein APF84_17430 [Gracilibacter sp. BRH_c7a]|nr:MAG: hypothetical protein APF84_17430 [Gracilibacter sp. BRH_c7a]